MITLNLTLDLTWGQYFNELGLLVLLLTKQSDRPRLVNKSFLDSHCVLLFTFLSFFLVAVRLLVEGIC